MITSFFSFCHTHKLAVDSYAQGDTAPTRHRGQGAVQSFERSVNSSPSFRNLLVLLKDAFAEQTLEGLDVGKLM